MISNVDVFVKELVLAGMLSIIITELGVSSSDEMTKSSSIFQKLFVHQDKDKCPTTSEELILERLRQVYHDCLGVKLRMDSHSFRKFVCRHSLYPANAVDALFKRKQASLLLLRREFEYGDFVDLLIQMIPRQVSPYTFLQDICVKNIFKSIDTQG